MNQCTSKAKSIIVTRWQWDSLVLGVGADVRLQADTVHCRISHAAVVQLHRNLSSDAAVLTNLRSTFHLLPHCQVLLHRCTQMHCHIHTATDTHKHRNTVQINIPSLLSYMAGLCKSSLECFDYHHNLINHRTFPDKYIIKTFITLLIFFHQVYHSQIVFVVHNARCYAHSQSTCVSNRSHFITLPRHYPNKSYLASLYLVPSIKIMIHQFTQWPSSLHLMIFFKKLLSSLLTSLLQWLGNVCSSNNKITIQVVQ